MAKRRRLVAPALIVVLAVVCGGWFLQSDVGIGSNLYTRAKVLDEVVSRIERHFVDEVDPDRLYSAALDGVVEELGDPNSALLQAPDWEDMRIRTEGEYGGVGLEIRDRDGYATVVAPISGTPGSRAGVRAGDRIVEVDGEPVEGWSTDEVADVLRGKPGTDVEMVVRRAGIEQPIVFELTRALIHLKAVPFAVLLEGEVGYLPVRSFNGTTTEEVRSRLDSLEAVGMQSLVIDLRGNRGGLLTEGVALSDLFLDAGARIVEVRSRDEDPERYLDDAAQDRPVLPIVVLVDVASASAAEIVAGALQDNDRALVLGTPSFGKGSVQSLFPIAGGRMLKLTTARWYTPSGRSIQRSAPDEIDDGEGEALSMVGEAVRPSADPDRPRHSSVGGRELLGGGGIVPDLWVPPDTLATAEAHAMRQLRSLGSDYVHALQEWAVEYLHEHPELRPDFAVTDADLADFHSLLVERGAEVTLAELATARTPVVYHLGGEVLRQAWGERVRFERLAPHDNQLERAVELLLEAPSQADLFRLAEDAERRARGLVAHSGGDDFPGR
ncbi:MAG: S41 family peptidase [Gemmatimonadetes bacterium]|nr:S41 family peptidase [Gemmatimonadota bacterium]